ncbi:MAG TPA: DUF4097 family beta strand repeat-containing protein [Ktedonobacteraceae bacterium]|nr:DUF4097 family beta strand repeat-containing protein [Ktedonobacteraceae bacterium]
MKTQDNPVIDQDFVGERDEAVATRENVPQQPPVWTGYAPGTPPPWAWQPGANRPYPPRHPGRWPWVVLAFVLLILLISGVTAALFGVFGFTGYAGSATEKQTFSVSPYPTLALTNDTGSIYVRAAPSGSAITIQATKHGSPWANLNDIQVTYTQNTTTNIVIVNVNRLNSASFFTGLSVNFDVTVPSAAALQLKTNTGSIDVSGVSGQMALSSNTGSLQVSSGTVRGNTALITNTGSVTFKGAIEQSGDYIFTTDTGSVNVTLPAESVFHVDASTDTGSINTNFPGIVVQHRQVVGSDAHADVGSLPQATITLRTSTGSINLYEG